MKCPSKLEAMASTLGLACILLVVVLEGAMGTGHGSGGNIDPRGLKPVKAVYQKMSSIAFGCPGLDSGDANISCQHDALEKRWGAGIDCTEKVPIKTQAVFLNCQPGYVIVEDYKVITCKFPGKWDNEMFTCDEEVTTTTTTTTTTKPTTKATTRTTATTRKQKGPNPRTKPTAKPNATAAANVTTSVVNTTTLATTTGTGPTTTTPTTTTGTGPTTTTLTTTTHTTTTGTGPTTTTPTTTTGTGPTTTTPTTTTPTTTTGTGPTTTTPTTTTPTTTTGTGPTTTTPTTTTPTTTTWTGPTTTTLSTTTTTGPTTTATTTTIPTTTTLPTTTTTVAAAATTTTVAAATTTTTVATTTTTPNTNGYDQQYDGKIYKFQDNRESFDNAVQRCGEDNATLVLFTTQAKLTHLLTVSNQQSFRVGISKPGSSFVTIDGTALPATPLWDAARFTSGGSGGNCVKYDTSTVSGVVVGLSRLKCSGDVEKYICEKKS